MAYSRTAAWVRHTPMVSAGEGLPCLVWFKCEFMQHTGSFKARGAFNRLLGARERGELSERTGIVVASGGNAGLANACAAACLGVPATIFVPESAPPNKVRKIGATGATIVQRGAEATMNRYTNQPALQGPIRKDPKWHTSQTPGQGVEP